jgi:hypothetical protein
MKIKAGPLFKRISPAQDYHRLGEENWEKLKNGESIDFDPPNELVEKEYLVKEKKQRQKKEVK